MTRNSRIATWLLWIGIGWTAWWAGPVAAHDMTETRIVLLLRDDGSFHAEVSADLDALALGADPTVDSGLLARRLAELDDAERDALVERLQRTLQRRLRVFADGQRVPFTVSFPARGRAPRPDEPPTMLGLVAHLDGRLPAATEQVAVRASRAFPPVELVVFREHGQEPIDVEQGVPSPDLPLIPEPRWAATALGWSSWESAALAGVRAMVGLGLGHVLLLCVAALAAPRSGRATVWITLAGLTLATFGAAGGALSLPFAVAAPAGALAILVAGLGAALLGHRADGPARLPWWSGAWSIAGLIHGSILGRRFAEISPTEAPDGAWLAFAGGAALSAIALGAAVLQLAEPLKHRSGRPILVLGLVVALIAAIALPASLATAPSSPNPAVSEAEPEGQKTLKNGRFTLFLQPIENPRRNLPSS